MEPRKIALIFITLGCALALSGGCSESSDETSSSANPPMVIEPNLRVGEVHAGMTVEQVVKQLGEPQRKTANALEYTRLGFAVMPGPDGVVQVVMCGDVTGINGPLAKAFTGRTKEGIGMNSTREEVIKAYGEPSASNKMIGGLESLKYQTLGITFTLEGRRVHHMIVRLETAPPPDQTMTIDLGSPPPAN
jgi:hypothetical protein